MESEQGAERYALVVDDNRINRRVATTMLERLGWAHVAEAENGLQALDLLKSSAFDLVLMDCEMPVMDGFASVRQIRLWEEENSKPACLIIALTARVQEGDRERCINAGMNDYLTKPLQFVELEAAIKRRVNEDATAHLSLEQVNSADIPVIDDSRYEKMCALLREGVQEFYHDYLTATKTKLDEIRSRSDMPLETSARLIHSIRGSAANVGAAKLHDLAEQLEQRLEAGETGVLLQQLSSLQETVHQLEGQLHKRLGQRRH